ncbi:hypothetical protein HDE_04060 [Halotydeus destructor]|nr:hypothetical protein HDE_04060 [Halotydeus destructor]
MALGPEFDIPLQHYLEVNDSLFKDFVSFKTFRKPISTISTKPTKFEFIYKKYILELFYAVLFDFFLLISGRKSFALNKMLFVANVRDALNPFGKRKFRFCNDNFVQLCSSQETADKILFNANPEDVAHMLSSKKSYLEFVRSGCIAYMKYKLDDQYTPESQPARERHMMKLRYREIVMGFAIHAMLLLFAYAVYYAFNFSFTALHGLKAV